MKTYHTMDLADWESLIKRGFPFDPSFGAHWIPLPNGRIFLVAKFSSDEMEARFAEATPSRRSLPHSVYEGTKTLSPEHVEELHHLFDEHESIEDRKKAASQATIFDVVRHVSKKYSLFRLTAF